MTARNLALFPVVMEEAPFLNVYYYVSWRKKSSLLMPYF
jgi:hypothetical protein